MSSFHSFELALTQDLSEKVDSKNLNKHSYLPDIVGATDSTLDLLVDRTRCSCCTTHIHEIRGSRSLSVRSFRTPRMVYASRAIGRYHMLLFSMRAIAPLTVSEKKAPSVVASMWALDMEVSPLLKF